jgi:hypothetical protein
MTPEGIQSLVAYLNWLVVEPYPSKKYEFVSWDCSSQYMEQIKFMFQTTKQKVPSFCRDHEQWCCLPRNVGSARTQLIPIVEHRYSCWFEAKQFTTWGSTFYGRNHHLKSCLPCCFFRTIHMHKGPFGYNRYIVGFKPQSRYSRHKSHLH